MAQLAEIFAAVSIAYLAFIILAMVYAALSTKDSEAHSPTFQDPESSD